MVELPIGTFLCPWGSSLRVTEIYVCMHRWSAMFPLVSASDGQCDERIPKELLFVTAMLSLKNSCL